jgi:hypothetical protein
MTGGGVSKHGSLVHSKADKIGVSARFGLFSWLLLEGEAAGWSTVGLLVLFSTARGLSSISSKDLLGKTIPKSDADD